LTVPRYTWPAEWAPHDATWIAWPHHEPDWPGKLELIPWVYAEIVRVLSAYERVDILVQNADVESAARTCLDAHRVNPGRYRFHRQRTNRSWLRDSAPTGVHDAGGRLAWLNWGFNAWAKYQNFDDDVHIGECVARVTHATRVEPQREAGKGPLILEGGGIETDGLGTMLVTEEWLLSDQQVRNPGFKREDYERAFAAWLGISRTIWLGEGCVGDDTHGHVDDVARFVSPGVVALAHEEDPADENHRRSLDNLHRLQRAKGATGASLRVVTLPYPRPVIMDGVRLPASYANFYIANGVVLVPTFNDANDRVALNTLAECFPGRAVVGIHSVDLVWGLGTLHCLTQQQPVARA
jgi:agmatine deiminase